MFFCLVLSLLVGGQQINRFSFFCCHTFGVVNPQAERSELRHAARAPSRAPGAGAKAAGAAGAPAAHGGGLRAEGATQRGGERGLKRGKPNTSSLPGFRKKRT